MKLRNAFIYAALGLFACGCTDGPTDVVEEGHSRLIELSPEEEQTSEDINQFYYDLTSSLAHKYKDDNFCVSPLNITSALTMAYNGFDSEAQQEFLSLSGAKDIASLNELMYQYMTQLPLLDSKRVKIEYANAIWYHQEYTLTPAFSSILTDKYASDFYPSDFVNKRQEICDAVNAWVNEKSNGLIKRLDIDPKSLREFISAGCMHFKAPWARKFNKENTHKAIFHGAKGDKEVDMMHNEKFLCNYVYNEYGEGIITSYGNGAFYAEFLMPHEGVDINDLFNEVCYSGNCDTQFMHQVNMDLRLPRFKIYQEYHLKPALREFGLNRPFDKMTLTMFNEAPESFITGVIHATSLEIDESGSTFAATTVVGGEGAFTPANKLTFDRPFVMLIKESKTNAIILASRINDI